MNKKNLIMLGIAGIGAYLLLRPKKASAESGTASKTSKNNKKRSGVVTGNYPKPVKLTSFGGPTDSIENLHGASFLPPVKKGESPTEYYERVPMWVKKVLNPKMATLDEFPIVSGKHWITGEKKSGPAGICYFLDPDAYYAAWRVDDPVDRTFAKNGRLWIFMMDSGVKTPLAPVIDWGPHPTIAAIDVSRGLKEYLEANGVKPSDIFIDRIPA